jgi:DNA-directed RNA polymerase subunit RPC12/RpoP
MYFKILRRRLGRAATFGFMDYCMRCERWLPSGRFYHKDEHGERTRYVECSDCQIHPVRWQHEFPAK